jgi:hypothetical protein
MTATAPSEAPARLVSVGLRSAVLPLRTEGLSSGMGLVIDELLLTELQSSGFDAIGHDDLAALVDFEQQRDLLACDEASCMAELGNALGVPYLVAGSAAGFDDKVVLTVKLLDVRQSRVLAPASGMAEGGEQVILGLITKAVSDLIRQSGL